jgi:Glycosyl transferases group 1
MASIFPIGEVATLVTGAGGSVLQLSMRRVHDLVAFCAPYELEDVVAEVTGADRIEVTNYPAVEQARRAYKLGRKALGSRRLARALTPRLPVPRLLREYELFFPVFNHPFELFALATVPDWRARCRVAACFISELWVQELPEYLIELLAEFDHVFIAVQHPVPEVGRIVGRSCTYLPLAADVCNFSPYPDRPARAIDVCNIGRRSAVTHEALLRLARERRIFYYYDTVRPSGTGGKQMTFSVGNAADHRLLLANLLQRTRYYLAYRGRVNEPEQTIGREEISARFYEGAAAGAVLLGEPPRSEEFSRQFDWPDAVIRLPFDSPDVGEVLGALDADPERLERAQRRNAREAALRHDWLYRIQTVFKAAGLPLTQGMLERQQRLEALAALAIDGDGEPDRPASALGS